MLFQTGHPFFFVHLFKFCQPKHLYCLLNQRDQENLFLLAHISPKSIPCPVRHTAMQKLTSAQQRRRNAQLGIATAQAVHSATVQKSAKELNSQLSTQCPQGSLIKKKSGGSC